MAAGKVDLAMRRENTRKNRWKYKLTDWIEDS